MMSEDKIDLKRLAELLEPDMKRTADAVLGSGMKGIGSIVDSCLDGKCDLIATKTATRTTEKLRPEIQEIRDRLEKMERAEPPSLAGEDIAKAVKEAMGEAKSPFIVEGHTAHDILDCPTCKPVIVNKLWESEEYRQAIAEKVCEDEECRNLFIKQLEAKGYEVMEAGRKEESWADRRLRERRERKSR